MDRAPDTLKIAEPDAYAPAAAAKAGAPRGKGAPCPRVFGAAGSPPPRILRNPALLGRWLARQGEGAVGSDVAVWVPSGGQPYWRVGRLVRFYPGGSIGLRACPDGVPRSFKRSAHAFQVHAGVRGDGAGRGAAEPLAPTRARRRVQHHVQLFCQRGCLPAATQHDGGTRRARGGVVATVEERGHHHRAVVAPPADRAVRRGRWRPRHVARPVQHAEGGHPGWRRHVSCVGCRPPRLNPTPRGVGRVWDGNIVPANRSLCDRCHVFGQPNHGPLDP